MKKIVFIAYSQDNEEHKAWVKKFADDLNTLGNFEVLLDQNQPKGSSLTRFMERGLECADKVLIIGTPQYKLKSESGKGAAFEGSIISTELMTNIDSTKFYPILRSGTFETAFPRILQSRIGDDISDDSNYDKVLHIIANAISDDNSSADIIQNSKQTSPNCHAVANIDLSLGVLYETYFNKPTGRIEGIAIDVTVTNIKNETRYFYQPLFKVSVPIDESHDSFTMLNAVTPISFPQKLEYGQQYSVAYKLTQGNIEMFASFLKKDSKATIKVVVSTTLKELSESNIYNISDIVKNSKYVK